VVFLLGFLGGFTKKPAEFFGYLSGFLNPDCKQICRLIYDFDPIVNCDFTDMLRRLISCRSIIIKLISNKTSDSALLVLASCD